MGALARAGAGVAPCPVIGYVIVRMKRVPLEPPEREGTRSRGRSHGVAEVARPQPGDNDSAARRDWLVRKYGATATIIAGHFCAS